MALSHYCALQEPLSCAFHFSYNCCDLISRSLVQWKGKTSKHFHLLFIFKKKEIIFYLFICNHKKINNKLLFFWILSSSPLLGTSPMKYFCLDTKPLTCSLSPTHPPWVLSNIHTQYWDQRKFVVHHGVHHFSVAFNGMNVLVLKYITINMMLLLCSVNTGMKSQGQESVVSYMKTLCNQTNSST